MVNFGDEEEEEEEDGNTLTKLPNKIIGEQKKSIYTRKGAFRL